MRAFLHRLIVPVLLCLLLPALSGAAGKGFTVKGVRYFSYATFTRVVFEIDQAAPYVLTRSSDGKSLELLAYEGPLAIEAAMPAISDGVISGIEARTDDGRKSILMRLDLAAGESKDFVLRAPDRIVVDVMRGSAAAKPPADAAGKQLTVVIDPGHGGPRDTGIVASRGVEKTLALQWSQSLKKLLQRSAVPLRPVLTREKDQALSLAERASSANASSAALFISLHAAPGKAVRVWVLDPEDEPTARTAPAARDFLGYETQSEMQELLWQRQQAAYARQSGALGRMIAQQPGMTGGPEPFQAPLAVLRPVAAAAVLVEVGMEADPARVMDAVAKGIEQYVRTGR